MASICSHSHRLLHIRSQTKADISNETFQENDDSLKAVWFNVSIRVGGGEVCSGDTSDSTGQWYQSSIKQILFTVDCIEKTRINKKKTGNGPISFKKVINQSNAKYPKTPS